MTQKLTHPRTKTATAHRKFIAQSGMLYPESAKLSLIVSFRPYLNLFFNLFFAVLFMVYLIALSINFWAFAQTHNPNIYSILWQYCSNSKQSTLKLKHQPTVWLSQHF